MQILDPDDGLREMLWATPLISSLDDLSRECLHEESKLWQQPDRLRASYLTFRQYEQDEPILSQGERATELVIVVSGRAAETRGDPDRGTRLIRELGEGQWCAEASALSLAPSLTSVTAVSDCVIAAIENRLFRQIFTTAEGDFQRRIEDSYRSRYLSLHLSSSPMFAALRPQELSDLERHAELITLQKGEIVAEQGAAANSFFLVRSGGVAAWRTETDGRRRILSYYMGNSSFGEHALATFSRNWPATFQTVARTDLVKLSRAAVHDLLDPESPAFAKLTHAANLFSRADPAELEEELAARRGRLEDPVAAELDVMVSRQSMKGGHALVIDQTRCVRCNLCVESCVAVHNDGIPRISKVGSRVFDHQVLINACYHCEIPECMFACEYGAIRRDREGGIHFVFDACVGCTECAKACPYDVIRMTGLPAHERPVKQSFLRTLLARISFLGQRWSAPKVEIGAQSLRPSGEVAEVQGKAIKCDHCKGLPFEACVYNCPTHAIDRFAPESLFQISSVGSEKGA